MSNSVTCSPQSDCEEEAQRLNRDCHCVTFNREKMREELLRLPAGDELYRMIVEERPHLFADSPVFIPEACLRRQAVIIQAVERVVALPAYQERVLAYAPDAAKRPVRAQGVFFGYDFHLSEAGPQLIEINTNAGGALINALLARAQLACEPDESGNGSSFRSASGGGVDQALEREYLEMFRTEWSLEHPERPLETVAIVDDDPSSQFLYPEFLLFKALFEGCGLTAIVCPPAAFEFDGKVLRAEGRCIDLVYNRLTDFGLEGPALAPLRDAHLAGAAVLTPHPRAHALYADKRNLALLSDEAALAELGVDADTRSLLTSGIAHTKTVDPACADELWASRKRLFFKPAAGYGSKAAYRGEKLTRRVFEEILQGNYVVQDLIPPSGRQLRMEGAAIELKVDLRNYVYRGRVQAVTTRLYQGQTTNFRTPGGGFAPVLMIPCIAEQLKASAGCL